MRRLINGGVILVGLAICAGLIISAGRQAVAMLEPTDAIRLEQMAAEAGSQVLICSWQLMDRWEPVVCKLEDQ